MSRERPNAGIIIFRSKPTVFIGAISALVTAQLEIASGDTITIETLTQHASDDPELMIAAMSPPKNVFG